ncbi:sugar ABC transporter permease [Paenibacillus alkaliterrae]|uniref:carbohydrate ABC transporter permease n=1 Tax=Paenibacillus alkaliterrae TaxID=320909 RepID=UPI001F1BEB98|nr:sugar ABC transporter permease [Paenibacillus alkaliterrae]MCF2941321.1 sugar ABC transporter permease [Paenibacillus alkaliterrae]
MHYGKISPYLFLLPTLLGLALFRLIPVGVSFYAGFTSWNIYSPPEWVGLDNYTEMFKSKPFWTVLQNTLQFSLVFVVSVCVTGLVFAVLLNAKLRGIRFFRGLFFLPVITSIVAVGIAWNWILTPQAGILNLLLEKVIGLTESVSWLGDKKYALYSLTMVYVWKNVGYQMIIYLAGLQSIPRELGEASKIDGANSFQSFFFVTLPLLTPTVFFVLIITIIESFNTFGITHSMTEGGPYNATNTLSYFIYQNAFVHFRMGYASALAYVLFLLTLLVTGIHFLVKKRWVKYQ